MRRLKGCYPGYLLLSDRPRQVPPGVSQIYFIERRPYETNKDGTLLGGRQERAVGSRRAF